MSEYTIEQAHEDGRHATRNQIDIKAWAALGCPECKEKVIG